MLLSKLGGVKIPLAPVGLDPLAARVAFGRRHARRRPVRRAAASGRGRIGRTERGAEVERPVDLDYAAAATHDQPQLFTFIYI
jgi:hypothetical protein